MARWALWRMLGVLALPGSIAIVIAPGCEPRDIYLFDEPEELGEVNEPDAGDDEPEPRPQPDEPDSDDVELPQPLCATSACERCVEADDCRAEATTLVCHPVTAACQVPCDPEAPAQQRACPLGEFCDPRGLCVDCVVNADCGPGPTPVCDEVRSLCVECAAPSDCPSERPVCDVLAARCVECIDDRQCAATGEVCLVEAQRCVGCRDDADCRLLDDDNRCLPDELRCVECIGDADCASDPSKPFCKLSEHECDDERE